MLRNFFSTATPAKTQALVIGKSIPAHNIKKQPGQNSSRANNSNAFTYRIMLAHGMDEVRKLAT
jgi:hypothetical protein